MSDQCFYVMVSFNRLDVMRPINKTVSLDGMHIAITGDPGHYRNTFQGKGVFIECIGTFRIVNGVVKYDWKTPGETGVFEYACEAFVRALRKIR